MIASPTIPPINAVLESVSTIASIHSIIIEVFIIAVLCLNTDVLMCLKFSLKKNSTAGKNAIKKYP
jgi:hypothetical protein